MNMRVISGFLLEVWVPYSFMLPTFFVSDIYSDFDKYRNCGERFHCISNNKCIDRGLVCDSVDNCGDYSDERDSDGTTCKRTGTLMTS